MIQRLNRDNELSVRRGKGAAGPLARGTNDDATFRLARTPSTEPIYRRAAVPRPQHR